VAISSTDTVACALYYNFYCNSECGLWQAKTKIIFLYCIKWWLLDTMSSMDHLQNSYLSICKAIEILSPWCENICIPINHTYSYDLVVDAEGVISRVKVIRTDCQAPSGSYIVNIRKSGKEPASKEPFSQTMCDFVFVDCPDGCYLIPSSSIKQKRAISLSVCSEYLIPIGKKK